MCIDRRLVTEVSGQLTSPIFSVQAVQELKNFEHSSMEEKLGTLS
jgi:hypothetical protein